MSKDRIVNLIFGAIVALGLGLMVVRTIRTGGPAPEPPMFSAGLSFHEAIGRAAMERKPLLVVFSASWCGPCQYYKRDALVDPTVEQWVGANALAVHVDVDTDAAVAEALSVTDIPTTVMMQGNTELGRVSGAKSATELMTWLTTTVQRAQPMPAPLSNPETPAETPPESPPGAPASE